MSDKKVKKIVGIMSGTSFDGVDFVLIQKKHQTYEYIDTGSVSFPLKLKREIEKLAEGGGSFRASQKLQFSLGKFYAASLAKIKSRKKWTFDLIGLHGQTVFHNPPFATSQIGEPSFLKKFNVPVVSDFRSKIVAFGGEGAPLAPIFHYEILKDKRDWAFLNLGGMSNITLKVKGKKIASDLGPANIYLDRAAQESLKEQFDKDGAQCERGLPDMKVVRSYIKSEKFFSKKIPKSCGREEFSEKSFEKLWGKMKSLRTEDKFATLAEISLWPIISFLKKEKVKDVYISGGGAKNKYFLKRLAYELDGVRVQTSEEALAIPVEAIEGASFALLADYKIQNKSVDLSYMGFKKSIGPLGRVD